MSTSLARRALDTSQHEINECPPPREFSFLRGHKHADIGIFGEDPQSWALACSRVS